MVTTKTEQSQICYICRHPVSDWTEKSGRMFTRCPQCGFVQILEGEMKSADGQTIYERAKDNVFLSDGNENYYLDPSNEKSCRLKLHWVKRYVPEGRTLLDAGANFGHFLKVCGDDYRAEGFDISPFSVTWSRDNLGVDNRVLSIYELPEEWNGKFGVVTAFDIIEHLSDPGKALKNLHRVCSPGGYFFLSTPDIGSPVSQFLGKRWHFLDPIQHVSLFSKKNLVSLLKEIGFEIVSIRSLGRYYHTGYIFDRLDNLHDSGFLKMLGKAGKRLPAGIRNCSVYVSLGDILGIVARKRKD